MLINMVEACIFLLDIPQILKSDTSVAQLRQ